ncbi:uncharacterized protein [Mytilus edulis]|uniref:uncharacterized protein n=1 Tax=Mytilus edulis TaxID=6550 RepID=UPI0039EE56AD
MTAHYYDTLTSLCLHTEDNDTANDASTVAAANCALNAVITLLLGAWFAAGSRVPRRLQGATNRLASLPSLCIQFMHLGWCSSYGPTNCYILPPALRKPVLNALHAVHQGVSTMCARTMDSEITVDNARVRDQCVYCHQMAKSNPMQPPFEITPQDYPFQMICSDYFTYNSNDYVVIVDRYSNWQMVYKSESGREGLDKRLRETFVTFGIPEELTSDGGPRFTAGKTQEFFRWQ